jgi:hypothetical protein
LTAENRTPDRSSLSATERAWREAQVESGLMNLQGADPIVLQEARAIFKRYVEGELTQREVDDTLNRLLEPTHQSAGRA